ncbi:MAG: AI-2E family transporter [Gammaproteobacteria bacterium CG_4_10_14_0_8_um_filter_38_16]|nr:MAG: AI-2E family transporter [Gammaproteobacteria bacterium CG_4_10_14_0_8_um_filter_38_16]PJA03536.1 MAG: AI-2E family transporter [Gammaproteobacteria bacterium CG_4_10_14_0_2_um_filter_38_22]PJB11158.1 MAG: AI-2E family transporter [Gammaproteobacteria bacterium CG_4_9_14_3_um_filter_38_9]
MSHSNPLLASISAWFRRNFSDPAAVGLFFTVLFFLLFLELFGDFFMPVLISIVLAYLLLSAVRLLTRLRCPHILAVVIVFLLFINLVVFSLIWLLPIVVHQLQNLITEFPNAFSHGHHWVNALIQKYPALFSDMRIQQAISFLQNEFSRMGQGVLKHIWALIPNLITAVLYFILVPLLLFFFLKDSKLIVRWFSQFLPKNRSLVSNVWKDVNNKIGCYVRGRVIEVILVGLVTSITFSIMGMEYAALLGVLVGLSVIIPYIGAVVVTIPVFVIALMQWGVSPHSVALLIAYAVIIILDANVLVPWLFSETMDLHPIVIILAVLVFGGLWGFWGVFFAIPLATVADSVMRAWPKSS